MDWFRAYHGLCTDPKLHRLARAAGVSRGLVVAAWIAVLETASAAESRGSIGDFDAVSLGFMIDVKPHVAEKILQGFRAAGMLDAGGVVTAWSKRQRSSDDTRVRKRNQREREATAKPLENGHSRQPRHVTNPAVEQIQTQIQNREDSPLTIPPAEPAVAAAEPPASPAGFREWWARYPLKKGKGAALKAYRSALKRADPEELMDGLDRAIADWQRHRSFPEFVPHPATWLNREGWADEHYHQNGSSDVIGEADRMTREILRKMDGHDHGEEFAGTHRFLPDRPPPYLWDGGEGDAGAPDVAEQPLH